MKKYDEYKDSSVPWIGEIPKDWEVKKLKYFSTQNDDVLSENTNTDYTFRYIDIGSVSFEQGIENYQEMTFENAPSRARRIVNKGDVIVSTVRTYLKAVAYIQDDNDVIVSTGFAVIRPLDVFDRYMKYLMLDNYFVERVSSLSTGVSYPAINCSTMANIPCVLPPKEIQHSIADYLDKKTSAIDSLIEDKQKLIELLKEKRQAIISEAVTKGLDKNAKMKDSGIEWIGEIPEEWEVRKFNDLCIRITDFVASGSFASLRENVQYYDNENYAMLIRTMDVSNKNNNITHVYIDETAYNFLKNSNLYGGEIILPNIGASVGDVYIVPNLYERMSLAPNSIMFKTLYEDMYYYYYFSSTYGRNALIQISQSAAQPKFNKTALRQLKVLAPFVDVQKEIVSYLNKETNKVDNLVVDITAQIEKLKEYRQAIISEAVTGKVAI